MSYLDQGNGNAYCKVIKVTNDTNYAIFISPDGTIITCEKSALNPGIYSIGSETAEADANIINSVDALYTRRYKECSLDDYVSMVLGAVVEKRALFFPLHHLPKMTKALAQGLTSIKEALAIYETEDDYKFLCFGYRQPIADYLDQVVRHDNLKNIFIFPDNLFVACGFQTRFNPSGIYMSADFDDFSMFTNDIERFDHVSLVGNVDYKTHLEYLERNFVNG